MNILPSTNLLNCRLKKITMEYLKYLTKIDSFISERYVDNKKGLTTKNMNYFNQYEIIILN